MDGGGGSSGSGMVGDSGGGGGGSRGGGTDQVRFLCGEGHRISRFHFQTHVVHIALDVQERTSLACRADQVQPHTVRNVLHLVKEKGNSE